MLKLLLDHKVEPSPPCRGFGVCGQPRGISAAWPVPQCSSLGCSRVLVAVVPRDRLPFPGLCPHSCQVRNSHIPFPARVHLSCTLPRAWPAAGKGSGVRARLWECCRQSPLHTGLTVPTPHTSGQPARRRRACEQELGSPSTCTHPRPFLPVP